MITKDNKAIERFSEENTHLIRIKDYYPEDCSEQEFTLVNDETLAELEQMKRDVVNNKKWEKRHRAGSLYIDDEDFIATLGLYTDSQEDELNFRLWFEQALSKCGTITVKRATLYFIDGLSARAIANMESVHHTSVITSIEKAKNALLKMLMKTLK